MESSTRLVKVSHLIEITYEKMQSLGYCKGYLRRISYSYKLFQAYADKNEIRYYNETLAFAFLHEYCKIFTDDNVNHEKYQSRKRAIAKLDEMYKYNLISAKKLFSRKTYIFHGCLKPSIESYLEYKSKILSDARLQSIKMYLERFSLYISMIDNIQSQSDMKHNHIIDFIHDCFKYTHNTLYAIAVCTRQYLQYLENDGFTKEKLFLFIPKIHKRRNQSFPHAFTQSQTTALLESITSNNAKERRDYAMILLAARVGLRASDIANIKFSNIDWEKNKINIVQQKTGTPVKIPLLKDVGEAIINYVKNGRPEVSDPHIFIRETTPHLKISGSSLHMIIDGYLKRAKIKIPSGQKHGPHALRHSVATRLLENDIPISTIKEILAHKSTDTTKIYLKVAQHQLLQCALEVIPSIGTDNNAHMQS